VPDDLRIRYFTPTEHGYEISKSIRNMVVFGEHDLGKRAPFPNIDVVICRNVLIYFTAELQMHTLRLFTFSLRASGYLVLGNAETASALSAYYSLVHPHFRVYRRSGSPMAPPVPVGLATGRISFGALAPVDNASPNALTRSSGRLRIALTGEQAAAHEIGQPAQTSRDRFAEQILGLPMGVVVIDPNYDVQTINSAAYTLLDIYRPAFGKDLLHLATRVPTKPLRAAIDTVFAAGGSTNASAAVTISVELEQIGQEDRHTLQITCYPSMREDSAPN
jgi:two-component system CheB/CheR fusion protein